MEEEKDNFIKSKLQEDKLISKKADEVFENFFKEMKEGNFMEKENKPKFNLLKYKKVLAVAACLVVLVGGANVYASTKGYGNVFFLIKYIVTGEKPEVTEKEDILSDRDITISYEKINITENITMQIEKLQIKDKIAKLIIHGYAEKMDDATPFTYKLYNESEKEICVQESDKAKEEGEWIDTLKIKNYDDQMKILKLKVYNPKMQVLKVIKIDLENRSIEVEEESQELQKISEIELKEFLGKYAVLYATLNGTIDTYKKENGNADEVKQRRENTTNVAIAMDMIVEKENISAKKIKFTTEKVNKAIKEICGEDNKGALKLIVDNEIVNYNSSKKLYEFGARDTVPYGYGLCINIENLTFKNGYYETEFTYCYPGEAEILGCSIDDLAVYKTTVIKFKLNENYEYTRYCLIDANEISPIEIKASKFNYEIENSTEDAQNSNNNENVEENTEERYVSVEDVLGVWKVSKATYRGNVDVEVSEVIGKGEPGVLIFYDDGVFEDNIRPVSSTEFVNHGTYQIDGRNQVLLKYDDNRTLRITYEGRIIYPCGDNGYRLFLKKANENEDDTIFTPVKKKSKGEILNEIKTYFTTVNNASVGSNQKVKITFRKYENNNTVKEKETDTSLLSSFIGKINSRIVNIDNSTTYEQWCNRERGNPKEQYLIMFMYDAHQTQIIWDSDNENVINMLWFNDKSKTIEIDKIDLGSNAEDVFDTLMQMMEMEEYK